MKPPIAPLLLLYGTTLLLLPTPGLAQKVYGGRIEPREVSPAVEACEYRLLVEEQVCNQRLNKSDCIEETRQYCLEQFSATDAAPAPPRQSDSEPRPQR